MIFLVSVGNSLASAYAHFGHYTPQRRRVMDTYKTPNSRIWEIVHSGVLPAIQELDHKGTTDFQF